MSHRIVGCLLLSIAVGIAAFVWTVSAGWGFVLGLLAYSLTGSVALVASAGAAVLIETVAEKALRPVPAMHGTMNAATAHTG